MTTKTDEQRAAEYEARIDLADPIAEICRRLDLDPNYVARLDVRPDHVTAELFRGKEGRCQGAKYIEVDTNEAAMETLKFETRS